MSGDSSDNDKATLEKVFNELENVTVTFEDEGGNKAIVRHKVNEEGFETTVNFEPEMKGKELKKKMYTKLAFFYANAIGIHASE